MKPLTHRQADLLAFIKRYQAANAGVSPTFAEMGRALGGISKGNIARLVDGLAERGRIRKIPHRARCIEVIDDTSLAHVPTAALMAELARRNREART